MQRYWDGRAWTEHIAPAAAPMPPSGSGSPGLPAADAPTPWVGGAPAGQTPHAQPDSTPQIQPFAPSPVESQPFSIPGPGYGAVPGPIDQPVPPSMVSADDRSTALLIHLLSLVVGFLGPLVVWLSKRDQSAFVDHHGKTALNFQFSLFVYWIGTVFAIFFIVGILLVPVLLVIQILFPIMAAIAANRGEYYRYPLAIPFIR